MVVGMEVDFSLRHKESMHREYRIGAGESHTDDFGVIQLWSVQLKSK